LPLLTAGLALSGRTKATKRYTNIPTTTALEATLSDVVRVTAWYADDAKSEAWVELEVLVHGGKSMPDVDALIAVARRLPLRTVERHRWLRIDGEWRRAPAVLIFMAP
jgi:hypothetical protein